VPGGQPAADQPAPGQPDPSEPDPGTSDPGAEVRLLHWNVHSWRDPAGKPNLESVAALIAEQDTDVVCLVEVLEPWAAPAALPELAARAGYTWIFVPSVEIGAERPARGYGNALLTRLPVLAVQQWRLTWPSAVYDGTEPSETRSVALARVQLPGAAAWVGSTHLPASSGRARSAALRRLTELTRRLEPPWAICGDYNTPATRWIRPGQPITVGPAPAQPTFPTGRPRKPIDYCIASPGVVLDARALAVTGSDHLPVLVRCRVPAAP
jgi:endonuclease/exonuclease/phosphatase family metal-dependent hydrolase